MAMWLQNETCTAACCAREAVQCSAGHPMQSTVCPVLCYSTIHQRAMQVNALYNSYCVCYKRAQTQHNTTQTNTQNAATNVCNMRIVHHSFTNSFTNSPIHSFTNLFANLCIYSCSKSFIFIRTHQLIHPCMHQVVHSFIHTASRSLTHAPTH